MSIPLESGRGFTRDDLSSEAGVAVVSASTARRFWPGRSPIGTHVRFVGDSTWHTIVGIVADVRAYDLTRVFPIGSRERSTCRTEPEPRSRTAGYQRR